MSATAEQPTVATEPPSPRRTTAPNPVLVVAAAFVLGVVLARVVDWMGPGRSRR
jgi:hypothetical protein